MRIFFTASYFGKSFYQKFYDVITTKLIASDFEIISLETDPNKNVLTPHNRYAFLADAARKCDAAIIEASVDSFRLGHETTLVLAQNKPVLCLSVNKDYSDFINNKNFIARPYNNIDELMNILDEFIDSVSLIGPKTRLSIQLTNKEMQKLEILSHQLDLSKSQTIGKLISDFPIE